MNRYRHGPNSSTEPDPPDLAKAVWEAFSYKGIEYIKSEYKRIKHKHFGPRRLIGRPPGELCKFEDFDSDEFLRHWKPITDSDFGHGYSTASLSRSVSGHALFKGVLDIRKPCDGLVAATGFASMVGPQRPPDNIFRAEKQWEWHQFNCLEVRLRGDGRKYGLIVSTGNMMFDQAYFDCYAYPLFTKGGPYWQTFRIPFSKLAFTYKGMLQDGQHRLPDYSVNFVGISLHDMISGPFSLEIDYIALLHEIGYYYESVAYESYDHPHIRLKPVEIESAMPDIVK